MCLAIISALQCSCQNVLILFLTAAAGPQLLGNTWIFQSYPNSCVYILPFSKQVHTVKLVLFDFPHQTQPGDVTRVSVFGPEALQTKPVSWARCGKKLLLKRSQVEESPFQNHHIEAPLMSRRGIQGRIFKVLLVTHSSPSTTAFLQVVAPGRSL